MPSSHLSFASETRLQPGPAKLHMLPWCCVSEARCAPAVLSSLKAQNNALHVTTEKLVSTNSELMERLNRQSEQVRALQDALAKAQAAEVPEKAALHQHEQGALAENSIRQTALSSRHGHSVKAVGEPKRLHCEASDW